MRIINCVTHVDGIVDLRIRLICRISCGSSTDRDGFIIIGLIGNRKGLEGRRIVSDGRVFAYTRNLCHRRSSHLCDCQELCFISIVLSCSPTLKVLVTRQLAYAGIVNNLSDFCRGIRCFNDHGGDWILACYILELNCQSRYYRFNHNVHRELPALEFHTLPFHIRHDIGIAGIVDMDYVHRVLFIHRAHFGDGHADGLFRLDVISGSIIEGDVHGVQSLDFSLDRFVYTVDDFSLGDLRHLHGGAFRECAGGRGHLDIQAVTVADEQLLFRVQLHVFRFFLIGFIGYVRFLGHSFCLFFEGLCQSLCLFLYFNSFCFCCDFTGFFLRTLVQPKLI